MRKKFVAGNWKMNGALSTNKSLILDMLPGLSKLSCNVVMCPPFPYLAQLSALLEASGVMLGAQDVSAHEVGAYTGEVSAAMLNDFGCSYVLVGHSERRQMHCETDLVVAEKFDVAQKNGLIPILCVGETLEQRERGVTEMVVTAQVSEVIRRVGISAFEHSLIAYEPVWAIGTGVTATPLQAQLVHQAIRSLLSSYSPDVASRVSIIYGGSVKPQTANELFSQPDIDGALVGGASLVAGDFLAICQVAV